MKPTGLGKGLSAIFETEDHNTPTLGSVSSEIELSKIEVNPSQPRTSFDEQALDELAASIARLGVIQPITLRETTGGKYQIVSGERRFRASKLAGLTSVPAYIRTVGDEQLLEMALVENIQREELDAIEIALSLSRLTNELGLTQEVLSASVGKRRSTVANYLRLLTLDETVQAAVKNSSITMGHARALVAVDDHQKQCDLLARVLKSELSVRATEELVKASTKAAQPKMKKIRMTNYSDRLMTVLGTKKIKVEANERGVGRITLNFTSAAELDRIIEKIENK
ncbi:MAG: ParB/RepB/Spo0J family partition protein [Mucinivorans sp.]